MYEDGVVPSHRLVCQTRANPASADKAHRYGDQFMRGCCNLLKERLEDDDFSNVFEFKKNQVVSKSNVCMFICLVGTWVCSRLIFSGVAFVKEHGCGLVSTTTRWHVKWFVAKYCYIASRFTDPIMSDEGSTHARYEAMTHRRWFPLFRIRIVKSTWVCRFQNVPAPMRSCHARHAWCERVVQLVLDSRVSFIFI